MTDNSNQAKPNSKELVTLLAASPIVNVSGVVSPMGVTGGQLPGEDRKMFFWLEPWRIGDADLQTHRLTVQRVVIGDELYQFMASISPYMAVRIRARVVLDAYADAPQGLLEELLGIETSDSELLAKAKELQAPVSVDDVTFGTLRLDPRVDWYSAKTPWKGKVIGLNLSAKSTTDLQKALESARVLWQYQTTWDRRIRRFAVQKLLPLKNDNWRRPFEFRMTGCQFRSRIKLRSITVKPDGAFEFWYDDGGLFWGHAIEIGGDLKYGPFRATIAG